MKKLLISGSRWRTILLFVFFFLTLLFKCAFFDYLITGNYVFGSIIKAPLYFLFYYSSAIFVSLFIASFVFLSKRRWWTVVVSLLIDIALLSNVLYFRANGLLINGYTILISNNLSGFGGSIKAYLKWEDAIPFLLTVALLALCLCYRKKDKDNVNVTGWLVGLIMSLCFFAVKPIHTMKWNDWNKKVAFQMFSYECLRDYKHYITYYNPLTYCVMVGEQAVSLLSHSAEDWRDVMDEQDVMAIETRMNPASGFDKICTDTVPRHLYLLFVESFESWTISETYTPNLVRFMEQHHDNLFYADKVRSETMRGTSMDAQLIVNTGLLPTREATVCNFYCNNCFYSLADVYAGFGAKTQMFVPHDRKIWNQDFMSEAFHFDSLASFDHFGNDEEMFAKLSEFVNDKDNRFVHAITISSHVPFEHEKEKYDLVLPDSIEYNDDIPLIVKNYLKAVHYMDSCLGAFLDGIDYENSVLAICGDHTWESNMAGSYTEAELALHKDENVYIPLIICSPSINGNRQIHESVYQMDIYPTLLNVLGMDGYCWKGFGVNLMDDEAVSNRMISEEEAYQLSDKIIRTDYFKSLKTK